jgi:hypothetical protein
MATITEDYVSFETAKLLKEKGMDISCFNHYVQKNNNDGTSEAVTVCTLQMAMKWLREEKNIFIDICTLSPLVYIYRVCLISDTTGYFYEDYACEEGERFMSYKEAVEFALDYCLNNILEV